MKRKNIITEIESLKYDLSDEEIKKLDTFFDEIKEHLSPTPSERDALLYHFVDAFDYYLKTGLSVEEICERLHWHNIQDYYKSQERIVYPLDDAGRIYPLGLRYGEMSVYRISCTLKKEVAPEILQMALDFSLKRFPSFACVIKSGVFWHYLERHNSVIEIEEERELPCKPFSLDIRSNQSFRLLYYKRRISIEMFHAISDGMGTITFLKSIIGEYFKLLGKEIEYSESLLDINQEVQEGELTNEYKNFEPSIKPKTVSTKRSVQLPGKYSSVVPNQIIHFSLKSDQVKQLAKQYHTSVTGYMISVLFWAVKQCVKEEGTFHIQIPVNVRKLYNKNTLRNYVIVVLIQIALKEIKDRQSLVNRINQQFHETTEEEYIHEFLQYSNWLRKTLDYIPIFIKVIFVKLIFDYIANSTVGLELSNLGLVEMPESIRDDIDCFDFVIIPGKPNKVNTSLISYGEKVRLTITKIIREDYFENAVFRILQEDGLSIELEGNEKYEG